MSAERIYALLLRVYPREFRSEYRREMTQLFRDQYRTRTANALGFWLIAVWDVAHSATSMWVEELSARDSNYTPTLEGIMKIAGTLAVLLGVYGVLGALAEAVAGMRTALEGVHFVSVVLGGIAAALLVTAGATLLRGTRSGPAAAAIVLTASFLITVIARLTHPWMSIFSQLVGIGLPIALLAVLNWRTGGPSASEAS